MKSFRTLSRNLCILVAFGLLVGCKTATEYAGVSPMETYEPPRGMFPKMVKKTNYAFNKVMYYFTTGQAIMADDISVTFEVLAYFEFLANDVKKLDLGLKPHELKKVEEARNELRDLIGMPHDLPVSDALDQFQSLSRLIATINRSTGKEIPEIAERRKILRAAYGEVDLLLKLAVKEEIKQVAQLPLSALRGRERK